MLNVTVFCIVVTTESLVAVCCLMTDFETVLEAT